MESASVYAVDFLEPGAVSTRPVPIARAEFQPAVQRLLMDVRLARKPPKEDGPVRLTPEAEEKLKAEYLAWCMGQGGGDCLGLLDDGLYLRTDDRRAFALALAFSSVLDETRQALARELLDVRALIHMVVWRDTRWGR